MNNSNIIITWEDAWYKQIMVLAIAPLEAKAEEGLLESRLFTNHIYAAVNTISYNICTQKSPYNWSNNLYVKLRETMAAYLTNKVLPALVEKHGEPLLHEFVRRCKNHEVMSSWYVKFFSYLDRYHVRYYGLPSLTDVCSSSFDTIVLPVARPLLAAAVMELLSSEYNGATVEKELIRETNKIFAERGMEIPDFQARMLESKRQLYTQKVGEWMAQGSTATYMQSADSALEEERLRAAAFLESDAAAQLVQEVDAQVMAGARVLVLRDVRAEFPVLPHSSESKTEASAEETQTQYMKALFVLHEKCTNEYPGSTLYPRALNYAFCELLNRDMGAHKVAEIIASFCDRLLKSGSVEKLSDTQVEEYLEKTVQLFSYLTDQDLFAEIYRNQLARRVLNQRSESHDTERLMISKLKSKCGAQFTAKMEGMLNDLALSTEQAASFHTFCKENTGLTGIGGVDFTVQVLTLSHWPTNRLIDSIRLPPLMQRCTQVYKEYYGAKTSHRRLQWVHSLGQCCVKGIFNNTRAFELQITTLQAIVMLAFNKGVDCPGGSAGAPISFATLQDSLGLPEDILKRVLHSLVCGKHRILKRVITDRITDRTADSATSASDGIAANMTIASGDSADKKDKILSTDIYSFNDDFTCAVRKVRIPMSLVEESHSPKRLEEDRSCAIDAAIVSIMKARHTLPHQQLVAEVLSKITFFRPDPKAIKQRIESLIDREFLERDAENQNTYKYLA